MTNLAKRPPLGLKQDKPLRSKKMLDKIRELPCAVCQAHGEQQLSPTTAHHPIHDRYGVYKTGDDWCVPLCDGHHQALWDDSKLAIHKGKREWREKYGSDWSYAPYAPREGEEMSNRKQKLAAMKSRNTVDDVASWLWDDVPLPEKAAGRSGQMTSSNLFKMLRMYERGASAKEISEAIGRSQGVVHTTLSRIRKQVNSRDLPRETQEKMRQVEQEFMDDLALYKAAQPVNKMGRLFDYIRSIRKK